MSAAGRWALPLAALLLLGGLGARPAAAEEPPKPQKPAAAEKDGEKKPPEDKVSRTHHTLTLGGEAIPYTATAGTLVLRDEEGKAKASFFYIAYVRDGVKDPRERPVTFTFNGGPGAAALWTNLGAFGPRRVELDAQGMPLPPPGRLVDNEDSLLDVTDLLCLDPVSTGYSRPAPGEDRKQFHGYKNDVESVGAFIRLWLERNARWASPKFVAGESYGTIRAAGLADHLQSRYGLDLNGVVLVSATLNDQNSEFDVGNDFVYLTYLPSYTAIAWYHKKLPPDLQGDLHKALAEAEGFALHDYALALFAGDRLPADQQKEIAARLARLTGLSVDYVQRANLRVEHEHFCKELLRDRALTVGRIDGRFTGRDRDAVGEVFDYDPSLTGLDAPFVAMMSDYVRRDLGFETDLIYERLSRQVRPWASPEVELRYLNAAEPLRRAMMKNPHLQVLIASGYYDLATPYFDGVYSAWHLGLPASDRGRVRNVFYEAGHMMYIRPQDHHKLHQDVAGFITAAMGK